ncbi:hypothetical protein [Roseibacillus persicicus]|nr:hypothetical protein [Roseibacillus persicicus]MDQ8189691.1 hypothetical protein [Roseibacillus persicicus]
MDAPLVAVAWLWMFSRLYYVKYQDPFVYWLLAGAVWLIYVVDRLRDAANEDPELRERHEFHWRHRKIFKVLVAAVAVACLVGFVLGVPVALVWDWPRGFPFSLAALAHALLTHGFIVVFLTACYFVVSQRSGNGMDSVLFKNALAALTFAFGTAIGAHFYTSEGVFAMMGSFEALGFAFLCLMNLNAIDLWEREEIAGEDLEVRDFLLTLPLLIIGFISLLAATFWHDYHKPFYYSMLLASAGLLSLDHFRARLSARLLRVLADVALLLPLPIFWFWFEN